MFSLYEKSQRSNKYTKTSEAGRIHRKCFPVLGPTAQGKERKRRTAGATLATPSLLEVRSHIHDQWTVTVMVYTRRPLALRVNLVLSLPSSVSAS